MHIRKKYSFIIIVFTFFLGNNTMGQDSTKVNDWSIYFKEINLADSLFLIKNYFLSAKAYSSAFANNNQGFSVGHKYSAAKAWAMNKNYDSAISNLQKEVEIGFYKLNSLTNEKAFNFLHNSLSWKRLINDVKKNKLLEDKKLGKYKIVKYELEDIHESDQYFRKSYMDIWQKFGKNSNQLNEHISQMKRIDSANLIKVKKILKKYGWIGYDTIGYKANQTLFLVIQHSDSATQVQFLPLLRQAVKNKKAMPEELALLEDRILVTQGKNQIYGTQVNCDSTGYKCIAFPIEDEKNVEKRRKVIGMQPLSEYLKSYGIEYKLPDN